MGMDETQDKAKLLLDILKKKKTLFWNIYELSKEQNTILSFDEKELETTRDLIYKKQKLIEKINVLDAQYEKVFNEIKKYITNSSELLEDIMKTIEDEKVDIAKIIIEIQSLDKINKDSVEKSMNQTEKRIQSMKKGKHTVANYNKMMDSQYDTVSVFLDKKK